MVLAPGDTERVLIPFHYGAPIIAAAAAGSPQTLDCSVPQVISVAEAVNMVTTVVQYNATIAAAAAAKGWAYIDPNPLVKALAATPGAIRPFPAFPPDPNATAAPFGTAISRDGIHPSAATQKLIAQSLQAAINAKYGSAIPAVP
jgi:phospholipase/lecithinase/hemolysin